MRTIMGVFRNPASDYYEYRIEELLIEREVLKNMLVFSGVPIDVIASSIQDSKADSQLWDTARRYRALHYTPPQRELTNGATRQE